jgi:hypothetical protein
MRGADAAPRQQFAQRLRHRDLPRLPARRVDARVERRVRALERIDRQRAGTNAAPNTRSAVNKVSSAIAVDTCVR